MSFRFGMSSRNGGRLRTKFTQEEDNKLRKLVEKYGTKNWEEISKHMPRRCGRQCRDRYCNYLEPGLSSTEWTEEEDALVLELYSKYGNHWVEISKHLSGRSGNNVKNRWYKYLYKLYDEKILKKSKDITTLENSLHMINDSDHMYTDIGTAFTTSKMGSASQKEANEKDLSELSILPLLESCKQFGSIFDLVDF